MPSKCPPSIKKHLTTLLKTENDCRVNVFLSEDKYNTAVFRCKGVLKNFCKAFPEGRGTKYTKHSDALDVGDSKNDNVHKDSRTDLGGK